MSLLLKILIIIVTFWMMEFIAWATHKYIMHGFLWKLHKDHHQVDKDKIFEKNDWFNWLADFNMLVKVLDKS